MTTEAKYYYESHITIEPVFDERRNEAYFIAKSYNFKLAELLMKKREVDSEERSSKDTFMTAHSKNLEDIVHRTKNCVIALQEAKFKVWRYKIEDTVLDSRIEDEMKLLN